MNEIPPCPSCGSEFSYPDGQMFACPECAHEWTAADIPANDQMDDDVVRDAHGNQLHDGDSVIVLKDLKVKGASSAVKAGTKVKKIRLVDGDHNIDCKIEGFGAMGLKSEFVKKV